MFPLDVRPVKVRRYLYGTFGLSGCSHALCSIGADLLRGQRGSDPTVAQLSFDLGLAAAYSPSDKICCA